MNIALIGRLGSGKSTAAQALVEVGWARHSWAEGVRDIFSMAYGQITPENYADMKAMRFSVKVNGQEYHRTGRELLQRIGTDALRDQVDQDFWIKAGLRRLTDHRTVNDDTRFLNEAAALKARGFTLVRIVRPGPDDHEIASRPCTTPDCKCRYSLHPSEVEQEKIEVDHVVVNNGTVEALAANIRFIAQGGAESLRGSRMAADWGNRAECHCQPDWPEHAFDCPLFHLPR